MLALLLVALLPLTVTAQTLGNTFVQCTSATAITNAISPGGVQTSPSQCATACASIVGNTYSYFQSPSNQCICSSAGPPASSTSSSGQGSDTCNAANTYSVYRLQTTYGFRGCGFVQALPSTIPVTLTSTLDDCFTQCRFSRGTVVSVDGPSGFYPCRCTAERSGNFPCEANSFFAFSHDVAAASAGLTRKRSVKRRSGAERYCPAGLTPCNILGSKDGYECLDTRSELESCGGCMHGQYGLKGKSIEGVNCVELEDDNFGSMTCKAGRCTREK